MREFEPKLKKKVFTREFFSKYIYILVIGLCLLLGVSYSLTFFTHNENIAAGSITTGELTINFTDRNINVSGMLPPDNDSEGILLYTKTLSMTNNTSIDGIVKLNLTRTSGFNLTDLRYALIVNGAIQTIGDMPANGELLTTAIMSGETVIVELRIWPQTSYSGSATTFVGTLDADIKYLGSKASTLASPAGKYVNFNCNGNTCEVWQIVKVQDDRLVLTRQADYSGATSRAWTGKYYSGLSFNDESLISSVSDESGHKNVYLLRTVKISGGSGTQADPYTLTNNVLSEPDKKTIATITYQEKIYSEVTGQSNGISYSTVATQKVYYNQTNYISKIHNNQFFAEWEEGNNTYNIGDVVNFTTNKTLIAKTAPIAVSIGYDNTISGFNCDNVQCAIVALYNAKQ